MCLQRRHLFTVCCIMVQTLIARLVNNGLGSFAHQKLLRRICVPILFHCDFLFFFCIPFFLGNEQHGALILCALVNVMVVDWWWYISQFSTHSSRDESHVCSSARYIHVWKRIFTLLAFKQFRWNLNREKKT